MSEKIMLIRIISILGHCLKVAGLSGLTKLRELLPSREQTADPLLTRSLVSICERCGGAFPKVGQILSTRADLLPPAWCVGLTALQDDMAPLSESEILGALEDNHLTSSFLFFDPKAVASATIAQVHRAIRLDDQREVAVKIMRPGVRRKLEQDCAIALFFGKYLARFPKLRSVPVIEAIADTNQILLAQTDFVREAAKLKRLANLFRDNESVIVPALHPDLCSEGILCMDYVSGMKKLTDKQLSDRKAKEAITGGLRALYKMIFVDGLVHCDLHPGNIMVAPDDRVVILDAGFMVELDDATRRSFAEFFWAIAFADGSTVARIVRETATRLPDGLNEAEFDRDISELIGRVGGLRARDFQVGSFVGDLFAIQHKHGIYGTSRFTLIILSLLVYEGVAKDRFPDLDFQKEAVPFVLAALAAKPSPPAEHTEGTALAAFALSRP
ncbi:MAG: AarF/ABC1/UbiB kinase family protein [Pyrinomonadaceae bacterium]|nr:AarF/ABC1/UbiB kinase family protein [Pyrinomonadaceae bacterium]